MNQIYHYGVFYVHICAILSDDRINDGAVKTLITKEAQERDVADPGGLKEASAFKGIRLLCFFYFGYCKIPRMRVRVQDFERLPNQPKHKSPPNGLIDYLRGFASGKTTGSQGGNVNAPASVIIPQYFVWCIKETSDKVNIFR